MSMYRKIREAGERHTSDRDADSTSLHGKYARGETSRTWQHHPWVMDAMAGSPKYLHWRKASGSIQMTAWIGWTWTALNRGLASVLPRYS